MNESNRPGPLPLQNPSNSSSKVARFKKSLLCVSIPLLLTMLFALIVYSIYVAVHEPDRQETVVLGQSKIASGSPAALRLIVRDRVSGKPVKGAKLELSILEKALQP